MTETRKYLVDVDEGSHVFIANIEVYAGGDTLDEAYELIEGYLQQQEISYTYFNPIDITEVDEVSL